MALGIRYCSSFCSSFTLSVASLPNKQAYTALLALFCLCVSLFHNMLVWNYDSLRDYEGIPWMFFSDSNKKQKDLKLNENLKKLKFQIHQYNFIFIYHQKFNMIIALWLLRALIGSVCTFIHHIE